MAIQLKWYSDSGLTTEFPGPIQTSHNSDGSTGDVDGVLYLGSNGTSLKYEANSNPGVDQITVTPTDASPASGHEATEIKLATSAGGLASATAGAALNLGTQILSGSVNAVAVHYRINAAYLTVGVSTELSLALNTILESAQ